MKKLDLEIWSDLACPWCYVGKRRLEAALARFPHPQDVHITWRSFELDPEAPAVRDPQISPAQLIAQKYGRSVAEAEGMIASMAKTAAGDGLEFHFEKARSGNTFDAHRLVHFAAERGLGGAAKERLFRAYMTEGEALGEKDVLLRLGIEIGLPAGELRAMLESTAYAEEVRKDEADALALGIRGVPCFVVDRRHGVSGAQAPEVLLGMLQKAWSELPEQPDLGAAPEGERCGPEGCASPRS